MKLFFKKTLISIIFGFSIFSSIGTLVHANAITDSMTEVGDQTSLTNYEGDIHSDAVDKRGVRNITSAIFYALDFAKYVIGTVAVLLLIYIGIKLTFGADEGVLTSLKDYFLALVVGFILIYVADIAVGIFYGETGEILSTSETAKEAALKGSYEVRGIYTFIELFLGAISTLTIIISGFRMMISQEDTSASKNHIMAAAAGLTMVGLSEVFIKDFLFSDYGSGINVDAGTGILVSLGNFALGFLASVSVAAFIYSGYLYVVSFVEGEPAEKAKNIMIGAVTGILIAAGAYALTNTLLDFEDSADVTSQVLSIEYRV